MRRIDCRTSPSFMPLPNRCISAAPRAALFFAILLVFPAGPAPAQFYQYVDRNGNAVITDAPPHGRASSKKVLREDGVYRSAPGAGGAAATADRESAAGPEEPKKNYNRVSVVLYMTDW